MAKVPEGCWSRWRTAWSTSPRKSRRQRTTPKRSGSLLNDVLPQTERAWFQIFAFFMMYIYIYVRPSYMYVAENVTQSRALVVSCVVRNVKMSRSFLVFSAWDHMFTSWSTLYWLKDLLYSLLTRARISWSMNDENASMVLVRELVANPSGLCWFKNPRGF